MSQGAGSHWEWSNNPNAVLLPPRVSNSPNAASDSERRTIRSCTDGPIEVRARKLAPQARGMVRLHLNGAKVRTTQNVGGILGKGNGS